MADFQLRCSSCQAEQLQNYSPFCSFCGHMTETFFDYEKAILRESENPYERFFDLLPVRDSSLLPSQQYTELVHATTLGEKYGLEQLYLKNETQLQTGTTKYRMAAISLPYMFEGGVRHFCSSSTGNSSTAYAQLIGNIPDLKMSLFTGSDFKNRVNYHDTPQIDHYILQGGTFVEAFDCAARFAARHGYTSERGFFNPGRREGLKLAFFEACDQHEPGFDWYVQAVSSAMGVYGTYKGARELMQLGLIQKLPALLCVQQASCSPMVQAWQDKAEQIRDEHIVSHPEGIAKAILRGNPSRAYPYVRHFVSESHGDFLAASEPEIRDARQEVLDCEGIEICFSAATAVAGVLKAARQGIVKPDDHILVNLTGSDRPAEPLPAHSTVIYKTNDEWDIP